MADPKKQEGIMVALMQRFEKQRLPRVMKIKKHVDQGQTLREHERIFLEEVIRDARQNIRHVQEIPECQHVFAKLAHLYKQIIDKAVENEKKA